MDRRNEDYGLLGANRTLDYRGHSTFVLPFGPNKLVLGSSSGWVARLVEDWQLSTIFNISTGIPMTVVGRSGLYESRSSSNFSPFGFSTTVAPADLTPEGAAMFGNFHGTGEVEWKEGAATGTYFPGVNFVRVPDPQCAAVTALDTAPDRCDALMQAVAVAGASGNTVVLKECATGNAGECRNEHDGEGPGLWSLDASLSKGDSRSPRAEATIPFRRFEHFQPSHALCSCAVPQRLWHESVLEPDQYFPSFGAFSQVGAKRNFSSLPRQFRATVRFGFLMRWCPPVSGESRPPRASL
jgi:hypothetical protein